MTATLNEALADPQRTIAEFRRQLDACRAERDDAQPSCRDCLYPIPEPKMTAG